MNIPINTIYIISDLNGIWNTVYLSMDAALVVVKKRVDILNEEYRNSEHFDLEYPEDAKMEHYTDEPEGPRGRLVASAHDYKIQIFIKESNVVIKNEYLVN